MLRAHPSLCVVRRTPSPRAQTIFSTELDLLLVRLHELSPVVSRFFILESDRTFTGLSKPRILSSALDTDPRFKPFLAKVTYQPFTGAPLARGESPFEQEIALRRAMTDLLRTEYPTDPATPPPVMVFSDVDEVPSRKTAELLAACDFASPVHLGMKSYLYSFEWQEGGETSSWRPTAVEWPQRGRGSDEFYRCVRVAHGAAGAAVFGRTWRARHVRLAAARDLTRGTRRHGKVTERVLANSGWHCSCAPLSLLSSPFSPSCSRPRARTQLVLPSPVRLCHQGDRLQPRRPARVPTLGAAPPREDPAHHLQRARLLRHAARGLHVPRLVQQAPARPVRFFLSLFSFLVSGPFVPPASGGESSSPRLRLVIAPAAGGTKRDADALVSLHHPPTLQEQERRRRPDVRRRARRRAALPLARRGQLHPRGRAGEARRRRVVETGEGVYC